MTPMLLHDLTKRALIHPPRWLPDNTCYLTITGSQAYGVNQDDSDQDIYGVCMPLKEIMFPHLAGEIPGFGTQIQRFESWSEHHVKRPDNQVTYDFAVFGIVKFFQLCMENNPNMLDTLATPRTCVIHSTSIAELIRENRKLFFHKGAYTKFRGYSYSQMSKIRNKVNSSNPKRAADIEKHGMDLKFAYHVVRLALECEQILTTHDLDLQRDREMLKSIRRGEWTFDRLEQWFTDKERTLEELYAQSDLRAQPDEPAIKRLLMSCIEQHYGSISQAVVVQPELTHVLTDLQAVLNKYQRM